MSNPKYQDLRISGLEPGLTIRTTNDNTGEVQHIALSDAAGMPLIVTGANTGERGLAEFDLAANQVYNLRVTSRAAGNKVVIRMNWYEDKGI